MTDFSVACKDVKKRKGNVTYKQLSGNNNIYLKWDGITDKIHFVMKKGMYYFLQEFSEDYIFTDWVLVVKEKPLSEKIFVNEYSSLSPDTLQVKYVKEALNKLEEWVTNNPDDCTPLQVMSAITRIFGDFKK